MEEIRIVLQQGTKGLTSSPTSSPTSTTSTTEQLILPTDHKESSDLPSPSNISAVSADITLSPAAVVEGAEENSDSDQNELKKIRIVLDVNAGSNLTGSSNIVNTDDNKINLEQ